MTNKVKKRHKELAAKLGVSRRTAANIIRTRGATQGASPVPVQAQPMRRDVMVRRYGGVVDAHYVILRFDPTKGETLDAAVSEARSEAAARSDLLQVAIRRMDRPDHAWVCQWTRESADDVWAFEWMPGCDDSAAAPLVLEPLAIVGGMQWLATTETFPNWTHFLSQLDPDELRCLRRVFDHDLGPLSPVWADVWDSLLVDTTAALGLRIGIARSRDLLANLTMFGVLRRNVHSSSQTSPSFAVTEVFFASSKIIGNWFDLQGPAHADERLAVLHELQVISTNLLRFSNTASRMSTASRIAGRAQLMGQIIGARGQHPNFARLFELLRLEHNRTCPDGARLVVQSQADAREPGTIET